MGLVIDTSVLIDAERRRLNIEQMLTLLADFKANTFAVSSVSLMELAHGVVRAKTSSVRKIRETFLEDLQASIPTIVVSDEIAIRAGQLDGTLRQAGLTIGTADAIIGATALTHGYAVATFNVRHFKTVPGLDVVEL